MTEPRSIEYVLTRDHFVEFQIHYIRHSAAGKRGIRNYRIIMGLAYLAAVIFFFFYFPGLPGIISMGLMALVGALHLATLQKGYERRVIKYVDRMVASGNAEKTLGQKTFTWDSEEATFVEGEAVTKFPLRDVKSLEESENCYLLFRDGITAVIVPKSAFENPQIREDFLRAFKKI